MTPDKPLYEKYNMVTASGISFPSTPKHIRENLSHKLRPYQEQAIGRWMHYIDNDSVNKKVPIQLLFNMATGSGKTLIMASLILDLYKRGYRNFIYFVNSKNIIEKTRDNFSNPGSSKYLFSNNIQIDGEKVEICEVENFSETDNNAINIIFTTIQGLHTDLNIPRENKLSYEEFDNKKIVLIGDEAHHNNSSTLLSKDDLEDNRSWESTISNIMDIAKDPILLEFTATIDLEDPNIYYKYFDRIIYRYDLKNFRQDGYSKDVFIYDVDSDLRSRMLQAIIISQYRKKVALRHGIWLKPVVLFKSKTIAENKANFRMFRELITSLSVNDLIEQKSGASNILADAFKKINLELTDIVEELKNDFMSERLLLIDGNNIDSDKQIRLNSLEDKDNEIRAIFAVDMLNEGWDVLNLFDIVRLYDTRDARNGAPGKTTIREAQLIGRGARYYPFVVDNPEQKYVRKFDNNENEELRLIEQLHYHSASNPKYIQEIRQALVTSGLMDENYVERTLELKESFKKTRTYTDGVVYINERVSRTEASIKDIRKATLYGFDFPKIVEISLPTNIGHITSVFDEVQNEHYSADEIVNLEFDFGRLIPANILRHAIAKNKAFRFNRISKKIFALNSIEEFMTMVGKVKIIVTGSKNTKNSLTSRQKLYIAEYVLSVIEAQIDQNDERYIGTEQFIAKPISQLFKDSIRRKYHTVDAGSDKEYGIPQFIAQNPKYRLNLAQKDWYAYKENYGTSEEKSLVVTLDSMIENLSEKWSDIYLLRNEKAVTIYSFDDGRAFEPDFLLFANDRKTGNVSWQIFIEPKGGQLFERDKWKEDFLLEITEKSDSHIFFENEDTRIIGMPFYNEEKRAEFIARLENIQ